MVTMGISFCSSNWVASKTARPLDDNPNETRSGVATGCRWFFGERNNDLVSCGLVRMPAAVVIHATGLTSVICGGQTMAHTPCK